MLVAFTYTSKVIFNHYYNKYRADNVWGKTCGMIFFYRGKFVNLHVET